jgi:hypothetical protein
MDGPKDKEVKVMQAFESVKRLVKEEVLAALEADEFEKSRELTGLMGELSGLQQRIVRALGNRPIEEALVSANRVSGAMPAPTEYPHFFRSADLLVKHGEQRDGGGVYEQKVPRPVYDQILKVLRAIKHSKVEFRAPEVISLADCPNYQVYLVLNALQKLHYLDTPQRGLYRFERRNESPWAAAAWEQVPHWPVAAH